MLDIDGDKQLSMVDLLWLCSEFSEETQLGTDLAELLELYMDKNVRPKFAKQTYIIDYGMFVSLISNCTLIDDFHYAFCQRLEDAHRIKQEKLEEKLMYSSPNKAKLGFKQHKVIETNTN